ncbi:MAG: S8 family serine peptidase [Promethearchaeota archaeon]
MLKSNDQSNQIIETFDQLDKLEVSSDYNGNIIVSFRKSSFNNTVRTRFEFYGGSIIEEWNNEFASVCGFAGIMPLEINKIAFQNEFPDALIETNEILETQMNYVSVQSAAVNSTWYLNGLTGDTDSSIAVLDTGINPLHSFFPGGYSPSDLSGDIVGWQNFVDSQPISDDNGHGTFISSVISGTGKDQYSSSSPSIIKIQGNYSHTEFFDEYSTPKNYSIKLFSFNASKVASNILINSSWHLEDDGIDKFWVELYQNESLVKYSFNEIQDQYYTIDHLLTSDNVGIYDIYLKYHKLLQAKPIFSFDTKISYFPEEYTENRKQFTGIANSTKIVAYKILNQSGFGRTSDLISALASVMQNRTKFHIVSVCLSVSTLGEDVSTVNAVIDELIENGVIVVIAAGNNGIEITDSLNRLAENKNAIVVGAINDKDQITSYSSRGKEIDGIIKPDIVAPGGSRISNHRSIIAAGSENDKATAAYGTSIATAIVSAAINILIEAKWKNWNQWNNLDLTKMVKVLKAILLMTASETNLEREEDPLTEVDEIDYSPTLSSGPLTFGLKDIHEGYGRLNIEAAVEALTKSVEVNEFIYGNLISSQENPLGTHVFARQINLNKDTQYSFNLSVSEPEANFNLLLFSNESNKFGEPILLQSSRKWYGDFDSFYFTPKYNQTNCILIIKAIEGQSDFNLNISVVENNFQPELRVPEVTYFDGVKNTTVMGFQEFSGMAPNKNYTIDEFRFYIEYFDNDSTNVPPQEVYVSIIELGINFSLNQFFAPDNIYTDGALFVSEYIKFPNPGTYHYFFIASDGSFKTRYPNTGQLSISIEFPTDSLQFPNYHNFNEGIGNWTYIGTGWEILTQNNHNDNRSRIYNDSWKSMYFGTYHNYPKNYTYQPINVVEDPYPNGTLISPLFNLTNLNNQNFQPFVKFGYRVSLNTGDFLYFQINLNWTGWVNLRTYANIEQDWVMEEINLTQYIGNFVQFRFETSLDEDFDSINYKGFMLDYFAIINYTNNYLPSINFDLNYDTFSFQESKFHKFSFSCEYFDLDNNYPAFVYLEINDNNYTMYNLYGDWNASSSLSGDIGIFFIKSLILEEIYDQSFRFHVSDGKTIVTSQYFNENKSLFNLVNPVPLEFNFFKDSKFIGYSFSNTDFSDYYITGTPTPKENTYWLQADNTWHPIIRLNRPYMYGGRGQSFGGFEQGYGSDWEINLITRALRLKDEYKVYLQFDYEISLQNEYFEPEDQLDKCVISISKDHGETWIILREFTYDDEDLSGTKNYDISQYSNEEIMIKFSLHSNDNIIGLGYGWLLSNIYIGYDKNMDFIHPEIKILSPEPDTTVNSIVKITANISDNLELDESRIYIYLNNNSVNRNYILYNSTTCLLEFNWDTNLYLDGTYEIRVVAYDKEGNKAESFITVITYNMSWWRDWGIYIIILSIAIVGGIGLYIFSEKKGKVWIENLRNVRAEKIRLKDIDKDQVIKRIELIEKEEELERPLTLYCKSCRSWFLSNEFDIICPICDHDQIYAAYNCPNCKNWFFKDEPNENYYCKNKTCEGVRLIRRDKEEIHEILAKEGKFPREFKRKTKKFSILDK